MQAYFTFFSELLPLIFCIFFRKKLNTKVLKVFFIYSIGLAVFATTSLLTRYVLQNLNLSLIIVRCYLAFEYSLFAYFLSLLYKNVIFKKVILTSVLGYWSFIVFDIFQNGKFIGEFVPVIEFLLFLFFLIYYFFERMNTLVAHPIYHSISFWICVGLLLYFSGNFFIFLLSNSSHEKGFISQIKVIYSFVTITKNILLSVAFFANDLPENSNDNNFQFPEELNLDSFNLKNTYQ